MEDLGDRKVALLAQVAQHVRLTSEVRLALPVHLRDQRRAVFELYPVDLTDATAAHRPGTQEALAEVPLDGDLLAVLEGLYREMTANRELERTFEDTVKEIQELIDQMTDEERRHYLSESLFLNFVSYENERLGALLKKLPKEV